MPGYNSIALGATCGQHGGLLMYIQDQFNFKPRDLYKPSNIWEGQFVDVSGGNLQKPITVCNIYKPPRNNNNNANITAFLDLYKPIIQTIARGNSDVIIAGDTNINLLKIRERQKFSDYLHLLVNNSFIPKINLPTRFARKNASLIDHIFCKMTSTTDINKVKSGILVNNTSDHFATFVFIKKTAPNINHHLKMSKFFRRMKLLFKIFVRN